MTMNREECPDDPRDSALRYCCCPVGKPSRSGQDGGVGMVRRVEVVLTLAADLPDRCQGGRQACRLR